MKRKYIFSEWWRENSPTVLKIVKGTNCSLDWLLTSPSLVKWGTNAINIFRILAIAIAIMSADSWPEDKCDVCANYSWNETCS